MVTLNHTRRVCEDVPFLTFDRLEWISLIALVLSFCHGGMTTHYFLKLSK